MDPLKLLVTGSKGRMGKAVWECAEQDSDVVPEAGIDLGDSLEEAIVKCDAIIDFTLPSFSNNLIEAAVEHQKFSSWERLVMMMRR